MQKLMCYLTVFALFYFEFEGNFRVQAPGGLYLEGRFIRGFFLRFEFGGANIWRGLFSEFYGRLCFWVMSIRLSGHLRKANNIVPFCLSPDQGDRSVQQNETRI